MPRRSKAFPDGVSLRELGIHPHVIKVFDSQSFGKANALQEAVLPSVVEGNDVFVEAPPHSGRKVLALMCTHQQIVTNADTHSRGVLAIVLVPSITRMNAYQHLFEICKPAGIRVTFFNEEHHGNTNGDVIVVTARRLNELVTSDSLNLQRLVITVIEDVSTFDVVALERAVSAIRTRSATCMIVAISQTHQSRADAVVRQYLRRERRYFFTQPADAVVSLAAPYHFLLCKEKEKTQYVATIVNAVCEDPKKTLILTSRRECRQYFEMLNANGSECYYLASTTAPQDYQRILHEFLLEEAPWRTLIVGGKLQEVDLLDVDVVIMTSPPSHALSDEEESQLFCRHFTDTVSPAKPLDIYVLCTSEELGDVSRMQRQLGFPGGVDVVDMAPSHSQIGALLRGTDVTRLMPGARVYEVS